MEKWIEISDYGPPKHFWIAARAVGIIYIRKLMPHQQFARSTWISGRSHKRYPWFHNKTPDVPCPPRHTWVPRHCQWLIDDPIGYPSLRRRSTTKAAKGHHWLIWKLTVHDGTQGDAQTKFPHFYYYLDYHPQEFAKLWALRDALAIRRAAGNRFQTNDVVVVVKFEDNALDTMNPRFDHTTNWNFQSAMISYLEWFYGEIRAWTNNMDPPSIAISSKSTI